MHHDNEQLERFVHRTLRSLPDRQAPRTLEHRVLAALAQRRALPWYRQSFQHWPLPARVAFLVLALLITGLTVLICSRGGVELGSASTRVQANLVSLHSTADVLGHLASSHLPSLSIPWLYALVAGLVSLYLAIFGLGATAYRVLIAKR